MLNTPPIAKFDNDAGISVIIGNTERLTTSASYVKLKEGRIKKAGGFGVYFTLFNSAGGTNSYGQVFKNGVAFGTERINSTTTPTEYGEYLQFDTGDLVQIYGKRAAGTGNTSISLFSVKGCLDYFDIITD